MASFLDKPTERKSLDDRIRKLSPSARKGVNNALKSFDRFCQTEYQRTSAEVFSELKLFKGEELHDKARDVLQGWIDWQYDQGKMTSGIKLRMSQLQTVLRHHKLKIHFEDFDDPLHYTKQIKEELHAITREEIQTIFRVAKGEKVSFYLALISTGARPGELLKIRKKDLDFSGQRVKIRIEATDTKTRAGRSVWLTKEAAKYLTIRIKDLRDNDLIWTRNENTNNAEVIEGQVFARYVDKVGLGKRYKSNGNRMITLYSFRSFFFGLASDVHREGYANLMVGHDGYLQQYDRMSDQKKLDWFLKLEPELIVDPTERQKQELESKSKKIDELEAKNLQNQMYADKIERQERMMKAMAKKLGMDVE
ncbi:MAG: hypothetical protein FJ357_06895 [Thaumarchaeota archaeon]|nr:hypothetical protein [Nitrososphaerota archaeon]